MELGDAEKVTGADHVDLMGGTDLHPHRVGIGHTLRPRSRPVEDEAGSLPHERGPVLWSTQWGSRRYRAGQVPTESPVIRTALEGSPPAWLGTPRSDPGVQQTSGSANGAASANVPLPTRPRGLPRCDGPPTCVPTEWSGPTLRRSQTGSHPPTDVEPSPSAAPLLTFGPPHSINRSEKPNRNDVLPANDLQKRNDVLLFAAE